MIKPQMFSKRIEPVGQQAWWLNQTSTSSFSFVVPDGVTKISAVVVGTGFTRISRGGTALLSGTTPLGGGVGGGNGGAAGTGDGNPGGGGAGGYSGNGGAGGNSNLVPAPTSISGSPGQAGNGGGGGGGGGRNKSVASGGAGGRGGAVRLTGQGANGTAGPVDTDGGNGSTNLGSGSAYGGGAKGVAGAPLRWMNDIPVTPGETLTVAQTVSTTNYTTAARIMWGGGRSYPFNAIDM